MTGQVALTLEDGLYELPGQEPLWIWARTCPLPKCDCRSALIVSTPHSRQALLEQARGVDDAWHARAGYLDIASRLEGVEVFQVDIDTVEVLPLAKGAPPALAEPPNVRAIAERLDGEVLDRIGHLWYRGKGTPDPETQSRAAKQIVVQGWKPGEMLAYDEALGGVRSDLYKLDGRLYEALDLYCIVPGCTCGEILVDVMTVMPRGGPHLGRVVVEPSGAPRIEASPNRSERLAQVWTAFQKRHPRYLDRLARRNALMQSIASRIVADVPARAQATPKVGRNDPCPCGSGKKHKKCCGAV
jgi:hypothetical protein